MELNINRGFGQKAINDAKRIEKQRSAFLQEHYSKMAEEKEAAEKRNLNEAMKSLKVSVGSAAARSKARVRNLEEEIRYTETAATTVAAEVISRLVEQSLMLDEEEYLAINPSYKDEIRAVVKDLLENASISENITNPDTLAIIESIAKALPEAATGKYLSEEEIKDVTVDQVMTPDDVKTALNRLSISVKDKVADIVADETENLEKMQADIDAVTANQEVVTESAIATKIGKTVFLKEQKTTGLFESLAVNAGLSMISEGKEYDADLALANAVLYTTILETLDVTGLLPLTEKAKKALIENAGGTTKEAAATTKTVAADVLVSKATAKAEKPAKVSSITEGVSAAELRLILEDQGYDFNLDDFNEIAAANGYRKNSNGRYTK